MRRAFNNLPCGMLLLIPMGISLVGCSDQPVKQADRLVDGIALPSEKMLSRETIEINRGFGGDGFGEHFLSYELAPDNSLAVTHTFRPNEQVVGREVFFLDHEVAMKARKLLWRLRPDDLQGVDTYVRPSGCVQRWVHDTPEIAVGFAASREMVGVFDLPRPASCETAAAKTARQMLSGVLASFPRSKVAEEFMK